ncbi:MAG: lytic transglycosylase domain-containing protein [Holosporales bacterium]|jgi:soluble lytic murein transglycosylase|nr:lytic transglycosylase domain-containing protein [Holosporales bacterium]
MFNKNFKILVILFLILNNAFCFSSEKSITQKLYVGSNSLVVTKTEQNLIEKYKRWRKVIENCSNSAEVFQFFYHHPNFPMFTKLVKIAEKNINKSMIDTNLVIQWFGRYSPTTPEGLISYSTLLLKNNKEKGKKYVNQTWMYQNLSPTFSKIYRRTFKAHISPKSDAKRTRRFVQANNYKQLQTMIGVIPVYIEKYIKLFIAKNPDRTVTKYNSINIDDLNLRYNTVKSLVKKKKYKKAAMILIANNNNEESSANKFFNLRRDIACNLARSGDAATAYKIISIHVLNKFHPKQRKNYVKAEWFAGFVAFRFLEDKKNSIRHFKNAYSSSEDSMHKSKCAFWLAEVFMSNNDIFLAYEWYEKSYRNYNTFYGQIAENRLNQISSSRFIKIKNSNETNVFSAEKRFNDRELVQILKVVQKYNLEKDPKFLLLFYRELVDDIDDPVEEGLLLKMAQTDRELEFITKREQDKQKYQFNIKTFKKLDSSEINYVERINPDSCFNSLVHSVIKRESFFKKNAKSHAGATGLMQIMPKTAIYEQKRIKFYTDVRDSLFNPEKNITIGSSILDRFLKKYKGNLILAIAAYNAGEGNIASFQKSIAKLRNLSELDMIELIPFKETRLYVKNVLYNMSVYQKIFSTMGCYNCNIIMGKGI